MVQTDQEHGPIFIAGPERSGTSARHADCQAVRECVVFLAFAVSARVLSVSRYRGEVVAMAFINFSPNTLNNQLLPQPYSMGLRARVKQKFIKIMRMVNGK